MPSKLPVKQFVQAVMRSFTRQGGLEPTLFRSNFRIKAASPGRVDFELAIKKEHLNRLGIVHGGTIASLVDLGGSLAVASTGRFQTGVSTDLNVTFLRSGGAPGEALVGQAVCEKIGKSMAYTMVMFYNARGELAARGSHTKFVANTEGEQYVAPDEYLQEDLD